MTVLSGQALILSFEPGSLRTKTPSPPVLATRWREPTGYSLFCGTGVGAAGAPAVWVGWAWAPAWAAAACAPTPNGIVIADWAAWAGSTGTIVFGPGVAVASASMWAGSFGIATLVSSFWAASCALVPKMSGSSNLEVFTNGPA